MREGLENKHQQKIQGTAVSTQLLLDFIQETLTLIQTLVELFPSLKTNSSKKIHIRAVGKQKISLLRTTL